MAAAPKFYADAHIQMAIVKQLRSHGVDIVHCAEVGKKDDKDVEHLIYCAAEERTILSFDTDFQFLHYEWLNQEQAHAGILQLHNSLQGASGIGRIIAIVLGYHENIVGGAGTVENDLYNQLHFEK